MLVNTTTSSVAQWEAGGNTFQGSMTSLKWPAWQQIRCAATSSGVFPIEVSIDRGVAHAGQLLQLFWSNHS